MTPIATQLQSNYGLSPVALLQIGELHTVLSLLPANNLTSVLD